MMGSIEEGETKCGCCCMHGCSFPDQGRFPGQQVWLKGSAKVTKRQNEVHERQRQYLMPTDTGLVRLRVASLPKLACRVADSSTV